MIARLERLSASLADVTIAVGPDAHRAFDTDLLIPPGIDADHDRSGGRSPHPSILFVGTWSGRKRGALLAERFRAEVRPRFPDSELWMVADRCTAGDGVRWLGAPSDAELRGLYASAWAFCLPSTYEGFGIPYAEALAAGTPVVASDNPGAQFVLRGGRDGVIAADAELGTALSRLLGDAAERDRLGRAGRERAQAFRWPALVDRHEEAYAMAVERFARRRGRR
jgi:glycosyltransferase involved in cell wall biosynthesis